MLPPFLLSIYKFSKAIKVGWMVIPLNLKSRFIQKIIKISGIWQYIFSGYQQSINSFLLNLGHHYIKFHACSISPEIYMHDWKK